MKQIEEETFFNLPGVAEFPGIVQVDARIMEIWMNDKGTRVGLLLLDNYDKDWSWIVLARGPYYPGKFICIGLDTSISSQEAAKMQIFNRLQNA